MYKFVLMPVTFETAYSLLRAIRGRRPVCVFGIYWATYCISSRVTSLLSQLPCWTYAVNLIR